MLGVVKREGSRINLPPPSSFSCLFSASGTLPSLGSRAAEGRAEAKLTGSGWLSGHHQIRKAVPTVVTHHVLGSRSPVVLAQLPSVAFSPPVALILPKSHFGRKDIIPTGSTALPCLGKQSFIFR